MIEQVFDTMIEQVFDTKVAWGVLEGPTVANVTYFVNVSNND